MPRKNPPTGTDADLNLATLSELFVNEQEARKFLESKRWPNGPVCPHCKATDVFPLMPKPGARTHARPGTYKCSKCREQFSVRVGTIFEDSKLPISKWLMAIHLMTSSKKGVSSHQIARELGITQKSAWFVCHRIREAMKKEPMATMLQGTVEVDETYVGGRPRRKHVRKRGRGTSKQPVMVLVERDGNARVFPIQNVDAKTLKGEIAVNVAKQALIMTDELSSYAGIRDDSTHRTVTHSKDEYVRIDPVHTQTADSFFALLKRGQEAITAPSISSARSICIATAPSSVSDGTTAR